MTDDDLPEAFKHGKLQGKLQHLVTKWREEAEPLLTQTHDPVYERGKGLEQCADELEELIEEHESA